MINIGIIMDSIYFGGKPYYITRQLVITNNLLATCDLLDWWCNSISSTNLYIRAVKIF